MKIWKVLLVLVVMGCASKEPVASPISTEKYLQIEVAHKKQRLQQAAQNQSVPFENLGLIHFSTFEVSLENAGLLMERRAELFKLNFKDDRDPYTGKVNPRTKCLKQVLKNQIYFKSGPGVQWADCSQELKPRAGVRTWIYCEPQKTIWEITFLTKEKITPQFTCL